MHKRDDGFVVVDEDVCIGCRYCHMACPYGAPQYNAAKGHMTKCDGCYQRVAEGKNRFASNPARCARWTLARSKSCVRNTANWLRLRRCHLRTLPNPVLSSNRTPIVVRAVIQPAIWPTRRRCEMGSGWHEWPLMIFTVFGQCVAGGFIVLALALMKGGLSNEQQQRVVLSMFGLWVLMGIGFIASTLHLGRRCGLLTRLTGLVLRR
jgi:ferredoxin